MCIRDRLDTGAVQKFFAYGYVPAPRTIYRKVRKLAPGGTVTFDLAANDIRLAQYWRFKIEADDHAPAEKIPALAEELRALLTVAVKRRLEADVPLGIYLSGGIDSTAILALAARARGPAGIDSFTIGFNEPSYDESRFAREAAASIGSRHHERIIDITDACRELPALLASLDEPFADPSILPTYLLARFAREHVTVALSGDGSDELFAGYDPFSALAPARHYQNFVPAPLHRVLRAGASKLPRGNANMLSLIHISCETLAGCAGGSGSGDRCVDHGERTTSGKPERPSGAHHRRAGRRNDPRHGAGYGRRHRTHRPARRRTCLLYTSRCV